eukprot:3789739-Prymnesium_polylepis.1
MEGTRSDPILAVARTCAWWAHRHAAQRVSTIRRDRHLQGELAALQLGGRDAVKLEEDILLVLVLVGRGVGRKLLSEASER